MRVPLVDLKPQYLDCKTDIDAAISAALDSQAFIMGATVSRLEEALQDYLGCKYAYGCASGTDALQIAMMAMGVGPGDEIITTPFTFAATAETIVVLGAKPVYVDIERDTFNMDVSRLADAITPRTKAIIPVHLYGQVSDMTELMAIAAKHDIVVIEDAAQALGARYKDQMACNIGHMSCTSFFPAKNLGAFGDAGGLFTNDPEYADRMNKIRLHGSTKRYYHEIVGMNSRIDALQAAIIHAKLPKLDEWNKMRLGVAAHYDELLADVPIQTPAVRSDRSHIYQQYTIAAERRDELQIHLREAGIPSAVHYPIPLFRQPAFRDPDFEDLCPISSTAAEGVLSLPMFPHLTTEQVEMVVEGIRSFYE